jgi:hypothetical protein
MWSLALKSASEFAQSLSEKSQLAIHFRVSFEKATL